jgi:nucleotide-binding universal stress UspA family protein
VADAAVDVAAGLAAKLDARVVVLHLLSIAPIAHADFVWVPTVYEVEQWNRKAEAALRATTERVRASQPGVTVESELITGIQPGDLVAAIEQRQPDLVVVGTHGRGFWSSLVLGSVARAVTRKSTVPVLTVRPEGVDPKATTVLVPIELGHVVDDALDFAVGLAATMGTKLRFLYVFPGADEIDIGSGTDMEAAIAVKAQAALELLAGPERSRDLQVESVTRFGRPARQIANEAKACNAAFVVMGTHARGFVERTVSGSVAEDVLQIAGRAVVTCRVPAET